MCVCVCVCVCCKEKESGREGGVSKYTAHDCFSDTVVNLLSSIVDNLFDSVGERGLRGVTVYLLYINFKEIQIFTTF